MANNLTAVISADTSKFVEEVRSAQHMLNKFIKEQKDLKSSGKDVSQVTDEQVAAYQRVIKNLDKISSGTMSTAKAEKELKKELKELKIQWANLSDTAKRSDFGKSLSDSCKTASTQLKTLKTQLRQVAEEVQNTKNKAKGGFGFDIDFKKLALGGAAMATGIGSIAAGATMAFNALKDGVTATMSFNKQQSVLQAVTGKSAEELNVLKEQALDLGSKTQYTASQIAGLQIELAKLGFNPNQIKDMTEHVQNFATAVGTDLSSAASLAGSTLRMFGLESEDTQKVADVLSKSCSASALSFEYLDSAMSTIGPVAKSFGLSLEDTTGILGVLANAGFDASSAATAGRNIILNLADANGKLARAMGQPVTSGKAMMDALKQLSAKGVDLAEALELTDKRSVAAFQTMLSGANSGKDLITTLEGATGAAKQMSDVMADNLEGDMAGLSSAWEGLMLALGGGQSVIRDIIQWLTALVQKVKDNVQAIMDWATDLYDNSILVRGILNAIVASFQSAFNTIVYIVKTAMNNIKGFFVVIGKVLEGDFSGAVDAWKNMLDTNHKNTLDYVRKQKETMDKAVSNTIKGRQKQEKAATQPTGITAPTLTTNGGNNSGGGNNGNGGKGGGGKTTKQKVKIEYEDDSLDYWKAKLQKLQKELSSKKLSPIDAKKTQEEISKVKKKIQEKEIELGIKPKKGSLADIDSQIQEIENKLKNLHPSIDRLEIEDLKIKKEALEKLKKDTEAVINTVTITGKKFETKGAKGSMQEASDKVSYYKERLSLTVEGSEDYEYLVKQLKEWTEKENEIKVRVDMDLSNAKEGSMKFFDSKITNLQAKLEVEAYGSPEYNKINDELKKLTKEKQKIEVKIDADNKSAMQKYEDISGAFYGIDGVVGSMDNLIDSIEDGANAWETFMGVLNVVDSTLNGIQSTIEAVTTVQQMLATTTEATSAIQTASTEQDTANTAQEMANSSAKIAMKTGEAIAGATASGAQMPFPLNLVAIAAGIAAVIAAIAQIGSFANGGIIQGATTIGDYNLARVNSGEMILNGRQQNNLFRAIDENRLGSNGGGFAGGEVKIKGSDLYLALKNYSKVQGTLGKNTGIR